MLLPWKPWKRRNKTGEVRRNYRPHLEPLENRDAPAVFTVTTVMDNGVNIPNKATPGSLRAAIINANNRPGPDTIRFAIVDGGADVKTINLPVALPRIADQVTIDGYSQPGSKANTRPLGQGDDAHLMIELNGANLAQVPTGLWISGKRAIGTVIKGLVINRFKAGGIEIRASNCTVSGCFIGTNPLGTQSQGNAIAGIFINGGSNNTIGGVTPDTRNLISGNTGKMDTPGIKISGSTATGNMIYNNYIGTDVNGKAALNNADTGVSIVGAGNGNKIGGDQPNQGNLISGNYGSGIFIWGGGGNFVQGNLIGTDRTGNNALPNGQFTNFPAFFWDGILVFDSSKNLIGGDKVGARNIISGNGPINSQPNGSGGVGVHIRLSNEKGAQANNNLVEGNYIGTNQDGDAKIPNGIGGVWIDGAPGNTVGGTVALPAVAGSPPGNLISGNNGPGVHVSGTSATGNTIAGNMIGTNNAGTAALGNGRGVFLEAPDNTVGGAAAGARNIISGNGIGVLIRGTATKNNTVQGNYIGTDLTGKLAVGNSGDGVQIRGGGPETLIGNLISANGYGARGNGINIITGNGGTIQGNLIGTDFTGTITKDANGKKLGNFGSGIQSQGGTGGVQIGGVNAAQGNIIGGNGGWGIDVTGAKIDWNKVGIDIASVFVGGALIATVAKLPNTKGGINSGNNTIGPNNTVAWNLGPGIRDVGGPDSLISQNSIFSNSGLGIDEGPLGPTLAGVPVLTSAMVAGGNTNVIGTLNSAPNTSYNLEFFGNDQADPSGYGQGQTYLGSATVTTDSIGYASFNITVPSAYGAFVTATATDPNSYTTEFSNALLMQTTSSGPPITGVSPSSGSINGGNSLIITGTGFSGATAVNIGGIPAAFTINSDSQITAIAPADSAGTVVVSVTTASGTSVPSLAAEYVYLAPPAPVVTGLSNSSGPIVGGTTLTINGSGFTGAVGVFFGDSPAASFTVLSDSQISAVSPMGPPGTVDVQVVTYSFSSPTTADQFTYQTAPLPTVTGVSPNSGSTVGLTWVTISGSGFTTATDVAFGGVSAADFIVDSDSQITALAPDNQPAGTVHITVTSLAGTSLPGTTDQFTFVPPPIPVVTAISPSSGSTSGGTEVVITGTNLSNTFDVEFGTVPASFFEVISDTEVDAVAPAAAAGTVDVTVTSDGGTSQTSAADQFTFVTPVAPTVTAISPHSGTTFGGTFVDITGTGLLNTSAVNFGSVPANFFEVMSDTEVEAWTPSESAGTVDVTVTTDGGTSQTSPADQFTFVTFPAPVVTGISPSVGQTVGGTSVTISGSNLSNSTDVFFGNYEAYSITVVSDSQLTAVSPAQPAGTVDVIVQSLGGFSATSQADRFTYADPVAGNDSYSVAHNHTLTISAPGVLANDSDPEGLSLSAILVTGPSHGTLTLNSNGSFTYVTNGYVGNDSFTYVANDGYANSNVATVTIAVTDQPPMANNDAYSVAHNHTLTVNAPGVLSNDMDPDGDALTAILVSGVSHGTLTFNSNGSFTDVPTTNYMGTDSFTYKAYDGFSYSNVVTVTINVTNTPPVAQNDSGVTTPMVPVTINVLANDSDPDGDSLTVMSVTQGAHGSAVINSNMTVTYTPTSSTYYGTDTFTYTISDGHGGTATAMVTVTIGHPQLLDGIPQDPTDVPGLTADQLQPAVVQAISILQSAGYDVSTLNQTTVHITNLPPGVLGVTYQNTIWIDQTAAGYGWFTGLVSGDWSLVAGNQFQAAADSLANGHIDLLTVVLHELGHVLGFESIDPAIQSQDWMTATLGTGIRRLPDLAGANSGPLIPLTNPSPADGPLPVGIFDPYFESVLGSDTGLFGDLANFILIGSGGL